MKKDLTNSELYAKNTMSFNLSDVSYMDVGDILFTPENESITYDTKLSQSLPDE